MEQTAQQKKSNDTPKTAEEKEKAKKIEVSKQIAIKLKSQWEKIAKRQQSGKVKVRDNRKITSVSLVKDENGKISVRVNMRSGRSIKDNAEQKELITFKKQSRQAYARSKIAELLKRIKEYGYAAVEGEIPAELKDAVLKSMAKANISTSYKGTKAEAQSATTKQTLNFNAKPSSNSSALPFAAGLNSSSNGKNSLESNGCYLSKDSLICSQPPQGYVPYTMKATPEMTTAFKTGRMEPVRIPDYFSGEAQKVAVKTSEEVLKHLAPIVNEIAEKGTDVHSKNTRIGSPSVTIIRKQETPNGPEEIHDKGDVYHIRTGSKKNDLLLFILDQDPSKLSPALKGLQNRIKEMTIKKCHLPEDCSDDKWKASAKELISSKGLGNQISFKDLDKEIKEGKTTYPPELEEKINKYKEAKTAEDKDNKEIEKQNKLKQMEVALTSSHLTENGEELKKELLKNGIKSVEDLEKNKAAVDKILLKNVLFEQKQGTYATTCDREELKKIDLLKKENAKHSSGLLNGKIPAEKANITVQEMIDSFKNSKDKKNAPKSSILALYAKKNGINEDTKITDDLMKKVERLNKIWTEKYQKNNLSFGVFLQENGLIPKKTKGQSVERMDPPKKEAKDHIVKGNDQTAIRDAVTKIKMEEALYLFKKQQEQKPLTPEEQKRIDEWKAKGVTSLKDFSSQNNEKSNALKAVGQISDKKAIPTYAERIKQAKEQQVAAAPAPQVTKEPSAKKGKSLQQQIANQPVKKNDTKTTTLTPAQSLALKQKGDNLGR